MNKRKPLERVVSIGACLLALYLLSSHRLGFLGSILVAILGIMIGRSMHRDGTVPNWFGENRDFSLKPAGVALIKAAVCFVAGMVWAVSISLAIRNGHLPD